MSRYAAGVWALASAASLAAFLLHPAAAAGGRAALTTLVPLYLAGMPASQIAMQTTIEIRMRVYTESGTALSVMTEGLALWTMLAVLGYLQWFVLLPAAARLTQRLLARWLSPSR